MLKDTKSLGNNKAPACESRGFVHKKRGVHFDTPPSCFLGGTFSFGAFLEPFLSALFKYGFFGRLRSFPFPGTPVCIECL